MRSRWILGAAFVTACAAASPPASPPATSSAGRPPPAAPEPRDAPSPAAQGPSGGAANPEPARRSIPIPGTALAIDLVEVPLSEGRSLWFGRTEVTWELLDAFVHGPEEVAPAEGADAVARPSKPYISMDRGFGHHGFPAISVSHRNAAEFCRWLSRKTNRTFRLPTREEWSKACERGSIDADRVPECAWCAENAQRKTHAVAGRAADAAGLFDMRGNACEWATQPDGTFVVMGGSYRDAAAKLDCGTCVAESKAWNASDPQIPKSEWWLADGGFIGFRVVCEDAASVPGAPSKDPGADRPAPEPDETPRAPSADQGKRKP